MNVSDKVVCIDDSPGWALGKALQKGTVYVVAGLDNHATGLGLFLVGLQGPSWYAKRFRNLADMKAENVTTTHCANVESSATGGAKGAQ